MTNLVAVIEGYASVFNAPDMNGDIVAPGAFSNALIQHPVSRIKMLYQHAAETPIGRWTAAEEDEKGLYVSGEILLNSERAREVYALLSGGAIDGLSIGYRTVRAQKDGRSERRRIVEAELWEVSVVTFPMADGARVSHLGAPREDDPPRAGLSALSTRRVLPPPSSASLLADAIRGAADILSL